MQVLVLAVPLAAEASGFGVQGSGTCQVLGGFRDLD